MEIKRQPIIQLSETLANMIAAGEVVERPASVVKELVENSIDAGASQIKIDLTESGLKRISVFDNGCGIEQAQIPVALMRHATSKIQTVNDLFHISSLGFRGEALPSIASVSLFTITSSVDGNSAYFMQYKGLAKCKEGMCSLPKGTRIDVENLFFNTPARYKHLGNVYQELSQTISYITKCAFANPGIAFSVTNNGKLVYQTDGRNDLMSIITDTLGNDVAKEMLAFEGQNALYQIHGYTSTNQIFRSNKNNIHILVNHRVIRNFNLLFAITDSYKTILPIGKFPLTILEIETDPSLIDVNVHPSKLEIRFTDEQELRQLITKTIANALYQATLVFDAKPLQEVRYELEVFPNTLELKEEGKGEPFTTPCKTAPTANETKKVKQDTTEWLWDTFKTDHSQPRYDLPDRETVNGVSDENTTIEKPLHIKQFEQVQMAQEQSFFESMKYLGQYHQTYLLMENQHNLYLVDQHAAMERCMYEKISATFQKSEQQSFELLVPISLEYALPDIPLMMLKQDALLGLGIEIGQLGNTTIVVKTIPTWIPAGLETEFLRDIFDHFMTDMNSGKARMLDNLAKSLSCKKSIKANMNIAAEEVSQLMKDLDMCKMPYTCPHGRPIMIQFKLYDIEKLFKRVM